MVKSPFSMFGWFNIHHFLVTEHPMFSDPRGFNPPRFRPWGSYRQDGAKLRFSSGFEARFSKKTKSGWWWGRFHLESGFAWEKDPRKLSKTDVAVCQNRIPLVNIKIAGKWMFIPLKMVLIGIDPYPYMFHIQVSHVPPPDLRCAPGWTPPRSPWRASAPASAATTWRRPALRRWRRPRRPSGASNGGVWCW